MEWTILIDQARFLGISKKVSARSVNPGQLFGIDSLTVIIG